MQKHLLWRGLPGHSLESCRINWSEQHILIDAAIVGTNEAGPFRLTYFLTLTNDWKVKDLNLQCLINNEERLIHLQRNALSLWSVNGSAMPEFTGCDYIDIVLTPLTNSLPVNHLHLQIGETAIIDVVYIDVPAKTITRVQQKYTRLGEFIYRFENVPNDFEADIMVDDRGLVTEYPGLFESVEL